MENLYYNLSEEEFSRGRKALLWIFALLFFLAGMGIIFMNVILHDESIRLSNSSAPFGISIVVGIIATLATVKRKDHYFIIDNDKIEFRYGMINPLKQVFLWINIREIYFPHRQKKLKLIMKDGSFFIINLTWIERKKSSYIRKHIFYVAKEKNINIIKIQTLSQK